MRKGLLSIFIAGIGFYFIYKYHAKMFEIHISAITGQQISFLFIDDLVSYSKLCMIITICISLVSFYLGMISFLKKNKSGFLGIVLSILLFIFAFVPFWKYFI